MSNDNDKERKVRLGKDQVSLLDPPNEGVIVDKLGKEWKISRTGAGLIVLRVPGTWDLHPDFYPSGMGLEPFCWWINEQL